MTNMRVSRILQLSLVLMGLCQARRDPPLGDPSASQESGEVPVSQLKMLSLGLAHLLKGVEENTGKLEQQGERVAAELDGATRSLESLRKQSLQTGRTHRQVRRNHISEKSNTKRTFTWRQYKSWPVCLTHLYPLVKALLLSSVLSLLG